MINADEEYYQCDYCGRTTGEFIETTGNHVLCTLEADHAALIAAAREAEEASRIIFDVSAKASLPNLQIACPHGAIPSFPSHAWWCDKCFYRFNDALDALAALLPEPDR